MRAKRSNSRRTEPNGLGTKQDQPKQNNPKEIPDLQSEFFPNPTVSYRLDEDGAKSKGQDHCDQEDPPQGKKRKKKP